MCGCPIYSWDKWRYTCFGDMKDKSIFFFQAEAGIRDHCVAGVQTCALPFWSFREKLGTYGSGRQQSPGTGSRTITRQWIRVRPGSRIQSNHSSVRGGGVHRSFIVSR